jgi:hypothetical protein
MHIAVITMSSLSLLASCGTLYLMLKTNQAVSGGVQKAEQEFDAAKTKLDKNVAVFKAAIGQMEI